MAEASELLGGVLDAVQAAGAEPVVHCCAEGFPFDLLGYALPDVPGLTWVAPALGTVIYLWGGRPFLTGAVAEFRARKPGMMLLIEMAITVAFVASWGATLGVLSHELDFWWELALLVVIMLLGHWLEMRSLAQTSSALDSLAALLPEDKDGPQRIVAVFLSSTEISISSAGSSRMMEKRRRAGKVVPPASRTSASTVPLTLTSRSVVASRRPFFEARSNTLERIGRVVRVVTTCCTCCSPARKASLLMVNFMTGTRALLSVGGGLSKDIDG